MGLLWGAAGLGLFLCLAIVGGVTLEDLGTALGQVPLPGYVLIAAAQALLIVLAAAKWRILLRMTTASRQVLCARDAVAATTLGVLAGHAIPLQVAMPAVRAWIARRHSISPQLAIGTSLLELVFEVIVLIAMAVMGLSIYLAGFPWFGGLLIMAVLVSGLTLMTGPVLAGGARLVGGAARAGDTRAGQALARLARGLHGAATLPRNTLWRLTGLSFVRYTLMAGLNVLILMQLLPGIDPWPLIVAYPLVLLMLSLPLTPGGLGLTEITWTGVLIDAGVPAPAAVGAALSLRLIASLGFLLAVPFLVGGMTPRERGAG